MLYIYNSVIYKYSLIYIYKSVIYKYCVPTEVRICLALDFNTIRNSPKVSRQVWHIQHYLIMTDAHWRV